MSTSAGRSAKPFAPRVRKGIILAGGAGTRLYPLTEVTTKQLLPVYDKPMIYYALSTLLLGGVAEILVISTPADLPRVRALLGDGSQFGVSFCYAEQPRPEGIAQAFLIGREFIAGEPVCLILGDNIFYGCAPELRRALEETEGATIFGYPVRDPNRYGVVEVDTQGEVLSIEEKPRQPRSNLAVPGLYVYGGNVTDLAAELRPSGRGELEITDLNMMYLRLNRLRVRKLGRETAWLDAGTFESLLAAATFVATIEQRQSVKIGCPEEAALQSGLLTVDALLQTISRMPKTDYRSYLEVVVEETRSLPGRL